MKRIIIIFFIFSVWSAAACECPPAVPVSKELSDKYDVIFYGRVDSIKPCSTDGIGTVYFSIFSLYKGSAEQHVAVDYDCTSACLMSFVQNEEWIIYSVYQKFDLLTVSLCSPSRKRITDRSVDYYQVSSQRTFEEENIFLEKIYGLQAFSSHNALNDQQKELQPHNEQPSAWGKLWLLLISLAVMALIFIIVKKYFKNDK
jgi:hypothetical protein